MNDGMAKYIYDVINGKIRIDQIDAGKAKEKERMKRLLALMLMIWAALAAGASAEGYTQAELDWAAGVTDQAALTLAEQAKYLDIQKQRQGGIALLALGEADTPFQIATGAQLAEMAQYVNAGDAAFASAHYVLTDDVDLSAYGNWTPIGEEDHPFMGIFDGQNHVVTGLKIDREGEGYQGLFGYVSGTDDDHRAQVKNVLVKDAQIRAQYDVGAVAGRYGKFTAGYVEPLENCAMIGGKIQGTSGSMGQSSCVGGVAGRAFGEIQRCYATGSIVGADNAREYGGVVGESHKLVNACYSTGSLSALGSYANDFGGIVGNAYGAVTNCYATGDITGSLNDAGTLGGIVGCALDKVTNCYATGSVKGWRAIGGVAGQAYGDTYAHATISGCVALNPSVESNPSYPIGRIAGVTGQESVLTDNRAWNGMAVNGSPLAEGGQNAVNGADLAYDASNGLAQQLEAIFGGNSEWTYTENGLPTLKNVGGTQTSELPSHVTKTIPTEIRTAQELRQLAEAVKSGLVNPSGVTYTLEADIDLSVLDGDWEPIGGYGHRFTGIFDGQGHTISGLKITVNPMYEGQGLFGVVSGVDAEHKAQIRNVIVKDVQITAGFMCVGSIVGVYDSNTEPLENCAMIGGSVTGENVVGGIVGLNGDGTIQNCYATGEVTTSGDYAGGIVGRNRDGTVENCYATGRITASGVGVGGIVGYNASTSSKVQNCAALGQTVSGTGNVQRVFNGLDHGTASGNYAWSGMKVNGSALPDNDAASPNGAALTYSDAAGLNVQFETIFGGSAAWTYTENGLPILKALKGAQSSALPSWMMSSENTIYISTAEQLKQLADEVNAGDHKSGKTYLLMNDIDLSEYANWTPIGTRYALAGGAGHPFAGVFDGQGHTIRGLSSKDNGLFGMVNGESEQAKAQVKNVVIENPNITSNGTAVGAIAGMYGAQHPDSHVEPLENCAVLGGTVQGATDVGGIAGVSCGSIKQCYVTANIKGSVEGNVGIGGIAGMAYGTIKDCYTTGDVEGDIQVGGIIGRSIYFAGSVESCYSTGSISAKKESANGIAGDGDAFVMANCVALGPSVSSHRIADADNKFANNYAWSGMQVNGQPVTDGQANNENGEDILAHDGLLYGKNGQIFAWPGFDTSVWELRSDQQNKLPRLRWTNADPTLSLSVQSSTATYTIDYKLNGGAMEAGRRNPTIYTVATPSFVLENPVRTGYAFVGWTGSNGATPQPRVGIGQGSTGNLYFEANWTAEHYRILYTGVEGVEVSALPTEHVFGMDTAIPNPAKTGYVFEGWTVNGSAWAILDLTLNGTAYTADIALEATWRKLPDTSNLPQTGDDSRAMLWGAVLAVCAAGMAALKRQKK